MQQVRVRTVHSVSVHRVIARTAIIATTAKLMGKSFQPIGHGSSFSRINYNNSGHRSFGPLQEHLRHMF